MALKKKSLGDWAPSFSDIGVGATNIPATGNLCPTTTNALWEITDAAHAIIGNSVTPNGWAVVFTAGNNLLDVYGPRTYPVVGSPTWEVRYKDNLTSVCYSATFTPTSTKLSDGVLPLVQGEVSEWQLRHSIHWVFPLGGFGISTGNHDGYTEYQLISPSGQILFHQRITLCIQLISMELSFLGNSAGSDVLWIGIPQNPATEGNTPPPNEPAGQTSTIDLPNRPGFTNVTDTSVTVAMGGVPKDSAHPHSQVTLRLERSTDLNTGWATVADNKVDITSNFYNDSGLQSKGVYWYRNVAYDNATSPIIGAPAEIILGTDGRDRLCETRIDTYIINGQPTVENPTTPGNLDPNDFCFFPSHLEEGFMEAGSGESITVGEAIVDDWWDNPVYMNIPLPVGTKLKILHDGFSFGTLRTIGSPEFQWRFGAPQGKEIWGLIHEATGKLIQAHPVNGGIEVLHRFSGDYVSATADPAGDYNRIVAFLDNSDGALIARLRDGTLWMVLIQSNVGHLYYSKDAGHQWIQYSIVNNNIVTPITVFDETFQLQDLTQLANDQMICLASLDDGLYCQSSSDDWQNIYRVGIITGTDNTFKIEAQKNTAQVSAASTTQRFVSSDSGKTWGEDLSWRN